ncbi:MAG: class II fumarate hydratase, partial [Planctomycetota bacterium]
SMGSMQVPRDVLYGAQTARAVENFPLSGWRIPPRMIAAIGQVKLACATVNRDRGAIDGAVAAAIIDAAREVADNQLDDQFPVDVFQTGSGTSSNMNANEVIASRARKILGGGKAATEAIHPNDQVNMAQSSNDVIPTAIQVAAALAILDTVIPALEHLAGRLEGKVEAFDQVVKIARTHLMDAVPIRLGQEFSGFAAQVRNSIPALRAAAERLSKLPIGGTAVGTGLNAPEGFGRKVAEALSEQTGGQFSETDNHFAAQAARDEMLQASAAMRGAAIAIGKIASDIRLLGSGPRCGIGELKLPALQPGSSIMPGKVNPVICESGIQVACQIVGFDAAIAAGVTGGVGSILELNVAMPMIAWNLLVGLDLLASVSRLLADKCIEGLEPDAQRCSEFIEQSLAMCTALAPEIGYDAAAELAKEAYATGQTIRQIITEKGLIENDRLSVLLDPRKQTGN